MALVRIVHVRLAWPRLAVAAAKLKPATAVLVVALAVVAIAVSVVLESHRQGFVTVAWQSRSVVEIKPEIGKASLTSLDTDWMSGHTGDSRAEVLEDGVPIGPGNALHQEIRDLGEGRYSFWHGNLYFSASDNTDPRDNGRSYTVRWPMPVSAKLHGTIRAAAVVLGLLAVLLIGWLRPRENAAARSSRATFWLAIGVFAIALVGQGVNFATRYCDPALAMTGVSILGVPYSDARGWHELGDSIAQGHGMNTTWPAMRPLYAVFLALFYTWTGASHLLAIGLNVVLIALAAALIFRIGEMLSSPMVGLLAALGFSLSRCTLDYSLTITTETLGLVLSLLCTLQLVRGVQTGKGSHLTWAGVWLGLSNLARPLTLTAAPLYLACVILLLWRRGRKAALIGAVLVGTGLTLTLTPWLIRQHVVYGINSISSNTSEALYAATTPKYGTWSSPVTREPGMGRSPGERYRAYMAGAKENLRHHWRFYLNNVADSFVGCFRVVGEAARPMLPLLSLVLVVGFTLSNCGESPRRRMILAGLCFVLWRGFSELIQHQGAMVDLAAIALLPLTTRRYLGLLHSVGLLGTIMGVAMFGMKSPDRRLYLLLEWGFLLPNLCLLAGACRLSARVVHGAHSADERDETVATAPGWFVWVHRVVILFLLVGAARLTWLTVTTDIPPRCLRLLTADEATQALGELTRRNPGLLSPADLTAPIQLDPTDWSPALGTRLSVFRCRFGTGGGLFYLPASARLCHWARFFQTRPYDRTVCFFQIDGFPYPKDTLWFQPVVLPGEFPKALRERTCLVICRVVYDPKYEHFGQQYLHEGIAVIPIEDGRPVFEAAHVTAHPLHPGTPGYAGP
jgi:hypothetical protein